jgi:small subunit ribosomal protein S1
VPILAVVPFGYFVNVGGWAGLIHRSEVSWSRSGADQQSYEPGQELDAVIVDVDEAKRRVSLSIKRLSEDPWISRARTLRAGQIVEGTVTKLVSFGAFVDLDIGIDGLIHVSQFTGDWRPDCRGLDFVGRFVQAGQRIRVRIADLDLEAKRCTLAMIDASTSGGP